MEKTRESEKEGTGTEKRRQHHTKIAAHHFSLAPQVLDLENQFQLAQTIIQYIGRKYWWFYDAGVSSDRHGEEGLISMVSRRWLAEKWAWKKARARMQHQSRVTAIRWAPQSKLQYRQIEHFKFIYLFRMVPFYNHTQAKVGQNLEMSWQKQVEHDANTTKPPWRHFPEQKRQYSDTDKGNVCLLLLL